MIKLLINICKCHCRAGNITWHEGIIQEKQIWIKIGGDKGGGSFKMVFEIANLKNPNAVYNTVVFSLFEAGDTPHNLSLGLKGYDDVIKSLNGYKWR